MPAPAAPAPAAPLLEASVLPQSAPMLELSAEILRPLIDDALVIVEDEVVIIGRGPLSQLIRKLRGLRVPYAFFIWLLSPLLNGAQSQPKQ